MKYLASIAFAFALFSTPVIAAPQCMPLDLILAHVKAQNVPASDIILSEDAGFIADYHRALGITIPDGSEPAKFLIVIFASHATIGIVERDGDCIRYHAKISIEDHRKAFAKSAAGV